MITTKVQSITQSSKNGIDHKKEVNNKTNKTVYIVFVSLLLDLLAFTIILPLLPTILERYRHDDSSGLYVRLSSQIRYFQELVGAPDKYSSVLFGGFLGSMFSFLQFVVSPIMGALSDCYGRKPILLVSLVSILHPLNADKKNSNKIYIYIIFRLEFHARMYFGHYHQIFFYSCWHVSLVA